MSTKPKPTSELKAERGYQDTLWAKWPRVEDWPGVLDIFEAAAFLRVHPCTIRDACKPDRKGKARLAHQRVFSSIRISKAALQGFGLVEKRGAA